MPRVRLTVRGLMIAVAVAGLIAWMCRLSVSYRRLSASYRSRAASYRSLMQIRIGMKFTAERDAQRDRWIQEQIRKYERTARNPWRPVAPQDLRNRWIQGQLRTYERAARYPWLPIALDPPEPSWPPRPGVNQTHRK